jgi:hypothetical protein
MKSSTLLLAVVMTASPLFAAGADAQNTRVGEWMVRAEKDSNGRTATTAATRQGSNVLLVQCVQPSLSNPSLRVVNTGLSETGDTGGPYKTGNSYAIKLQVDKKAVYDLEGGAVSERAVEIPLPKKVFAEMLGGKEYTFRMTKDNTSIEDIFRAGDPAKALADVNRECGDSNSASVRSAHVTRRHHSAQRVRG